MTHSAKARRTTSPEGAFAPFKTFAPRALAIAALASVFVVTPVALAASGCGSTATTDEEERAEGGSPDIVLEGTVTDEMQVAFESTLEQKQPEANAARGPGLESPAEGTEFDKAAPPTFRWKVTSQNEFELEIERAPAHAEPRKGTTRSVRSIVASLAGLGEGIAHAHGTPTTGSVTFLVFSVPGDDKAVRVLTSRNEFTLTSDQMTKLAKANQTITLVMTGFVAEENRVSEGPFVGSTNRFSIKP